MTIAPITLAANELEAIAFWEERIHAASVQRLLALIEEHDEYAAEGGHSLLEPIRAEVMSRVGAIVDLYTDWASE